MQFRLAVIDSRFEPSWTLRCLFKRRNFTTCTKGEKGDDVRVEGTLEKRKNGLVWWPRKAEKRGSEQPPAANERALGWMRFEQHHRFATIMAENAGKTSDVVFIEAGFLLMAPEVWGFRFSRNVRPNPLSALVRRESAQLRLTFKAFSSEFKIYIQIFNYSTTL